MPTPKPPRAPECEVWLIGRPADLDKIVAAVRDVAHIVAEPDRTRLSGGDAGKQRAYLRVTFIPTREAARDASPTR
jgi:hypothetical protein